MTRRRPPTRAGFSLIELIVVIAIIAILVSLILPAVQRIRGSGKRGQASAEMSQLELACTSFKNKFGFNPPTSFRIPVTYQFTNTAHPDYPGTLVFQRMFRSFGRGASDNTAITPALANAGTTLTGSASLVYFLGGPPTTIGTAGVGWAVDAPIAASASAAAKHMFYEFVGNRVASTGEYTDPWGSPYGYFGSVDGGAYVNNSITITNISSTFTIFPFNTGPSKWVKPGGVQVFSAGENLRFGPGGAWSAGAGNYTYGTPGGDDIGSWHKGILSTLD